MKKSDWVYHKKYGVGQVTTVSAGYIYVDFCGQIKIFAAKDAPKHLVVANDNQFVIIQGELKKYVGSSSSVKIPATVSRIGEFAFANNTNIVSVDFNKAIFAIGDHAFENCSKLQAIQNCDGLMRIGSYAFNNCIRLSWISLPSTLQIIEKSVFCDCGALKEISLSSNIKAISASVFRGCYSLEKVLGLGSVTEIYDGAFSGCSKLHIDLPNGLERIHNRAFYNCDKLHPLVIPESVTDIADDAFANNDRTITLYGTPGSYAEKYARKQNHMFYNKKAVPKPTPPATKVEKNISPLISTLSAIKETKVEEAKAVIPPKSTSNSTHTNAAPARAESSSLQPASKADNEHYPNNIGNNNHGTGANKNTISFTATPETPVAPQDTNASTKKRKHRWLAAVIALVILLGSVLGVYHDRVNNIAQNLINGEVKTADGIYTGDLDWGIIQGTGTMQFPDGSVYTGLFTSGEPSGEGTMIFSDGSVYDGLFSSGLASGTGNLIWADSSSYEGEWSAGYMDGSGTMLYSDGSKYTGDFSQGQRSGHGTYQWLDGSTYEGEWLNDLPHGTGYIKLGSSTTYDGTFSNGNFIEGTYTEQKTTYSTSITIDTNRNTTFTIHFSDGTTVAGTPVKNGQECLISYSTGDTYEGSLVDGTRNGHGTFTWASGEIYSGNWVNDEMSGAGSFTFVDGSSLAGEFLSNGFVTGTAKISSSNTTFEIEVTDGKLSSNIKVTLSDGTQYAGTYSGNKLTGTGTITYSDGDKYVGAITNGQLHGKGIYTWSDGEKYDGNWSDGKMNGSGTYYFGSTQRLTGSFKDNKPNGTCYYYTSDGTRYTTYWNTSGMDSIYKG